MPGPRIGLNMIPHPLAGPFQHIKGSLGFRTAGHLLAPEARRRYQVLHCQYHVQFTNKRWLPDLSVNWGASTLWFRPYPAHPKTHCSVLFALRFFALRFFALRLHRSCVRGQCLTECPACENLSHAHSRRPMCTMPGMPFFLLNQSPAANPTSSYRAPRALSPRLSASGRARERRLVLTQALPSSKLHRDSASRANDLARNSFLHPLSGLACH